MFGSKDISPVPQCRGMIPTVFVACEGTVVTCYRTVVAGLNTPGEAHHQQEEVDLDRINSAQEHESRSWYNT